MRMFCTAFAGPVSVTHQKGKHLAIGQREGSYGVVSQGFRKKVRAGIHLTCVRTLVCKLAQRKKRPGRPSARPALTPYSPDLRSGKTDPPLLIDPSWPVFQGPDSCGQALLQIGINMMALPGGRHLDSIPLQEQR